MSDNIDIFVCAHKPIPYDYHLTNKAFKIVCGEKDNVVEEGNHLDVDVIHIKEEISNVGFSEWQKFYYIWKYKYNDLKKYVGLMHYRRFLDFGGDINDIPDMDEIFKKCNLVVGDVLYAKSMWGQYAFCHNIKDLESLRDLIYKEFPDYKEAFDVVMKGEKLMICNTCILKKEDFNNFCSFMFSVLFRWCHINGINIRDDKSFFDYIDKNIGDYSKKHKKEDETFREQARIPAFLSERLFTVWLTKNNMRAKTVPIRKLKEKEKPENKE